jgi:hypothetical protein
MEAEMTAWQAVTTGLEHGGYAAWEATMADAAGEGARDHVPVFATLCPPPGQDMSLAGAIAATLALPGLRLSRHERDLLVTEQAVAPAEGWPHEVRLVAFWPRARLSDMPRFWQVVQVGPPLALPVAEDAVAGENLTTTQGDLDPAVPLAAVIDDGVGFLNARFRRRHDHTRIRAVWLQAERQTGTVATDVLSGQVLSAAEIDALLTKGDEAATYAGMNRALLPITDCALTNRRAAHGTHVLDLAAGCAPWGDDPLRQVPILAVQLPPAGVRETAGRRMEAYLVEGLRWILAEALRQAYGTEVPPVVVTISLGSLAGPGDRTAFLADWFRHELARHARLGKGAKVRLVIAYGNARLSRLSARDELRRQHPMDLVWRTQPDDHTSSHLELRADAGMVAGLRLDLTPPAGSGLPGLEIDWPAHATGWRLTAPGGAPLAAVSARVEPGGQSLLLLSLAPTVGLGSLAANPPGGWRVTLRTLKVEPVRVTARVQRDDTPPGYRSLGRQSWLDHPLGWDWDEELRSYLAPRRAEDAPGCPVTREGSAVAYAGAEDPAILFVGAARPAPGQPGAAAPAPYSAEGVRHLARPGESAGPTLVALGDDGVFRAGQRAAGVLSGSVVRMSGTSMAAPQVARALLRHWLATPADQQTPEAERRALTGTDAWGEPNLRMGHGLLVGEGKGTPPPRPA